MPDFPYVPPETPRQRESRMQAEAATARRQVASQHFSSLSLLQKAAPFLNAYAGDALTAIEFEKRSFGRKKLHVVGGWAIGSSYVEPSGYTQQGGGHSTVLYGQDDRLYAGVPVWRGEVEIVPSTSFIAGQPTVSEYVDMAKANGLSDVVLNTSTVITTVMRNPDAIRARINEHLSGSGHSL